MQLATDMGCRYNRPMDLGAGFGSLTIAAQSAYRELLHHLVRLAQACSVPIFIAPPLSLGGDVNGASGAVLNLKADTFLITAEHVLAAYENRLKVERVNWQVGSMPPFDPVPRVAYRDRLSDIVLLRLSADEATRLLQGAQLESHSVSDSMGWPPPPVQPGQLVLVSGFPAVNREMDRPSGEIRAGALSAMFRVTTVGYGYCMCQIVYKELVSAAGPLPEPGTAMGGLSGGPVLLVADLSYPLVGIITDQCPMTYADFEALRIATLEDVTLDGIRDVPK